MRGRCPTYSTADLTLFCYCCWKRGFRFRTFGIFSLIVAFTARSKRQLVPRKPLQVYLMIFFSYIKENIKNRNYNNLVSSLISILQAPQSWSHLAFGNMESPPQQIISSTPPTPAANIITMPVMAQDGIYAYISIRGVLSGDDCTVFGISLEEKLAIEKRFTTSSLPINHGMTIKSNVFQVLNSMSKLGYKVVCSSGDKEIIWTMQREI